MNWLKRLFGGGLPYRATAGSAVATSAPLRRHPIICEINGCTAEATHLHQWEDKTKLPPDCYRRRYVCAKHDAAFGPWEPCTQNAAGQTPAAKKEVCHE